MNRVLLIGSNGLLGKRVKSRLIEEGYCVIGVTRSEGFDIRVQESFDLLDYEFEYVVNLAALVQVSVDRIEDAIMVNGLGALNAAEFSKKAGAMFINASTISAHQCSNNDYCKSYYAISKRLGDELVERYSVDRKLSCTILRFPQLYDTECVAEKYQPMLYRIIKQLKYDKSVTLYGNSNPSRNYLHIDDAASAILISMKDNRTGVWNCIHPLSINLMGLVKTVAELIDVPVCVNRLEDKEDIPYLEIPDQDLFHLSHPEWKPKELSAGLKDILAHV